MKKLLTIMLTTLMVASLAACSKKEETEATATPEETAAAETTAPTETEDSIIAIANPWIECNDGQEAAEIAGFEFEVPESETSAMAYRAIEGQVFEVSYGGVEGTVVRKGLGFEASTLSGDYTEYANGGNLEVGDVTVTYAGKDEETVNNAYWTVGDYAYSLYDANGVSLDALTQFVEAVK